MPFATAVTSLLDATSEGGGGDGGDVTCLITDEFNRVTSPHPGGFTNGNGWGVSENVGRQWQGSSASTWVDNGSGIMRIFGPNEPAMSGFDEISAQEAFLNWGYEAGAMDILLHLQLTRTLLAQDGVDPTDYGEWMSVYFGDGPPFSGNGKWVIDFADPAYGLVISLFYAPFTSIVVPYGSLVLTSPFYVHVTCAGVGQPIVVKMWNDSGTEASAPVSNSALTAGTFSNHGWTIALETQNAVVPSALEMHLFDIDIAGVTSCEAYPGTTGFEEYDRADALGAWGTTSDGHAWTALSLTGASTGGITSEVGWVRGDGGAAVLAPGPWEVGDAWTMWVRFRFVGDLTPAAVVELQLTFTENVPPSSLGCIVGMKGSARGISLFSFGSNVSADYTGWTAGRWYNLYVVRGATETNAIFQDEVLGSGPSVHAVHGALDFSGKQLNVTCRGLIGIGNPWTGGIDIDFIRFLT